MKKKLLFVLAAASVVGLGYYFDLGQYVTLAHIQHESIHLKEYVSHYYVWSVLAFISFYVATLIVGIPSVAPMTLLGGFLFGVAPGVLFSITSATLGAFISFLIMRYTLASFIKGHYKDRLQGFNDRIKKYGSTYLLILHLMAVVPFIVINALAAVTNVTIFNFLWTTIAGGIPLFFVYSYAGQKLGTMKTIGDIFSPEIVVLMLSLVVLAMLPMIMKKIKSRCTDEFEV